MHFRNRKETDELHNQDAAVPAPMLSGTYSSFDFYSDYEYPVSTVNKATSGDKSNPTRERLAAYWETEKKRLSQIALKTEEAEGKYSVACMAATEATNEVSVLTHHAVSETCPVFTT